MSSPAKPTTSNAQLQSINFPNSEKSFYPIWISSIGARRFDYILHQNDRKGDRLVYSLPLKLLEMSNIACHICLTNSRCMHTSDLRFRHLPVGTSRETRKSGGPTDIWREPISEIGWICPYVTCNLYQLTILSRSNSSWSLFIQDPRYVEVINGFAKLSIS